MMDTTLKTVHEYYINGFNMYVNIRSFFFFSFVKLGSELIY